MSDSPAPELSVVIPFRDEAGSIATLLAELAGVLDVLPLTSEILLVDDGSCDEGAAIVSRLAGMDDRIRLLALSAPTGQSAALEAGFRSARGQVVATLDADGQNDPADLPGLLAALADADCVCGVRVDRRDGLVRSMASRVANGVRRRALGDGVRDVGCSMRVMRAVPLSRVKLFRGGHRFLPALLRLEGARIVEHPVRHRPRRHGRSKYAVGRRLAVVWLDLLGVIWWSHRTDHYEVRELSRPRA